MLLKYEELLADAEGVLRRLCAFLGEPFEEGMLAYHRSSEAHTSGSLSISWQNTARPVLTENREKFRTRLTPAEIMQIEAICMAGMKQLGYQLTTPDSVLSSEGERLGRPAIRYQAFETMLSLKVGVRHLCKDRNAGMRIRKILFLKYLGIARRGGRHA
jgi:hypothetical protein